jgi:probable F420-dependent oxidoreductase
VDLGRLGVWTWLDGHSAADALAFARRIEQLGYGALFVPEAMGRDPMALIAHLAAGTERLVFATGIANIYARDPLAMRAARETLAELSNGRFVLGLGVSHAPMVSAIRGHEYGKPVSTMRAYLEALEKAPFAGQRAAEPAPLLLAALRPNMLALAAESAAGAHPYFMTPDHTRKAREILGVGPILAPEQKVLLESDPVAARAIARAAMAMYLNLPNYRNGLLWTGFEERDLEDGGSDRLVDGVVAWGDEDAIRARIAAHHAAGADHVCIQPLRADGGPGPDLTTLERLAPAA